MLPRKVHRLENYYSDLSRPRRKGHIDNTADRSWVLPNRLDIGLAWDQTCIHQHKLLYLPEQKYEIVKKLQELKHICRMTGDGCSPALKRANIGIAVSAATDAGRGTSDIVLTKP
ncbi:unnamed protein product [Brassica rapa subsp. trilocularis]|uniref:(rape) hypothetical protein n=1 Tax=Brassica napus TaxID=3708 RepID=A0A816TIN0_BRANA|nr:unnamed protein product [Brassica napus]